MTLKNYLFAFALSAFMQAAGSQNAAAQSMETDKLPERPVAERIVLGASPVVDAYFSIGMAGEEETVEENAKGEAIVRTALQYLGARYRRGHSGPKTFDCSGFTSYVFRSENILLTRSSRSQYTEGMPVASISDLQKGDLVFFGGSASTRRVGHVGIVTEVDPTANKFKFVHAARTGVKVDDSNSAYYSRCYLGARRILAD